jgi:AcrR family transcriptional regulator
LTRDEIIDAALPLLVRDGVEGLTVRSVADAIGISGPAVYHYFAGRDDLLDRLCERVAAEVDLAIAPGTRWDDAIVGVVLNMDRTFARYPGVATRVLPARRHSPAAMTISQTVHRLLLDGGLTLDRAADALAALHFLFGGWLLGRRPMLHERTTDPSLLERSIRSLLRGFTA